MKPGARFFALSKVVPRVTIVAGSSASSLISFSGFGVVVTQARGSRPRRSPNIAMSHVSRAYRHAHNSSAHSASCCGPRSRSGSSAENSIACAPFFQTSRRRLAM